MCQIGLFKAIKYCGSQQALAKAIGVSQPYVNHLLNRGNDIPDIHALAIFSMAKGTIPLEELTSNAKSIRRLIDSVILFEKFPQITINCHDINIGGISCPIYKNQDDIQFNLYDNALTRPILIDNHNQLITCSCRVMANVLLKNKKVTVHQINLGDVLTGKISIDQLLALLPHSEKVAVAEALSQKLGKRQGVRTDVMCKRYQKAKGLLDEYPQVKPGIKSRSVIACLAGFGSDFTYRQTKEVVDKGVPQLIVAMDSGYCSVSKACQIAKMAESEQYRWLESARHQQRILNIKKCGKIS